MVKVLNNNSEFYFEWDYIEIKWDRAILELHLILFSY